MTTATHLAPVFPDGYPAARRLMPLLHSAWWAEIKGREARESAARIRRDATRADPLLFGLAYLTPHLTDRASGVISFSRMHLAISDRAARFASPVEDRSAWAKPRDMGNTTWWFLIVPLWAAAHGHRDFALMLSHTGDQARDHLGTLKGIIEGGGRLLEDFPHLAPGRPWTVGNAVTRGGQRFTAAGLEKTILGAKHGEIRPNLGLLDDIDAEAGDFTPASKAKTNGRLVNDVLPALDPRAAVAIGGTPTGVGSHMHDAVRAARGLPGALEDRGEWVRAEGFTPFWWPAIVNAGTDREGSAWETRWPLARLQKMRADSPRVFALQRQCDPDDPAAAQWWTDDERTSVFRYDAHFEAVWHILSIDGALTTNTKNDETALVMVGVGPGVGEDREICVEWAVSGHWSRPEIKQHVWDLTRQFSRTCRTWLVDATGRGEEAEAALAAPPHGVTVVPYTTTQDSKRYRIETLFDDYARGAVWHRAPLTKLQAQQCAWKPGQTRAAGDDLIDAVRAAKDYALYGDASRAPVRRRRGTR